MPCKESVYLYVYSESSNFLSRDKAESIEWCKAKELQIEGHYWTEGSFVNIHITSFVGPTVLATVAVRLEDLDVIVFFRFGPNNPLPHVHHRFCDIFL